MPDSKLSDTMLKELIVKRGSIKGRVTKFKAYLDSLTSLEEVSAVEISKLAMKLSRVEALFIEFDGLQSQIESLNEDNQSNELTTRDLIEQEFDTCIAIAQDFIRVHESASSASREKENNVSNYCSHSNGCHHHNHSNCEGVGFKLPNIQVSKFDGTYFKWLEFKEIYCSLIHDNDKIQTIHKFHYLNSYLEGEAARVLSNLEVSAKNYNEAWTLLCNRYDNKRQLINNHLKSLFNFESARETDKSLRLMIDHVNKNLRALSTLGLPTDKWDVLIIHILLTKLDNNTMFKWEEHRNNIKSEIPTLDDFFSFLRNRADVIETVNSNKYDKSIINKQGSQHYSQPKTQARAFVATAQETPTSSSISNFVCVVCAGNHRVYECDTFKSKGPEDRNAIVEKLQLCHNCLRSGHKTRTCRLPGSCRSCKKRHNSLLHVASTKVTPSPDLSTSIAMSALSSPSEILLCTARVILSNPTTNECTTVRALLDSGSQSSFITERVKQRLNLTPQPSNVSIIAIGNNPLNLNTERCALQLYSYDKSFRVSVLCLVLKKIADDIPKMPFDASSLNVTKLQLADPSFNEPAPIDMLIGSDLFWDLIGSKQQSLGIDNPNLRSSKLGWLIAGPIPNPSRRVRTIKPITCNFLIKQETSNLNEELAKFWELESVPNVMPQTEEERLCESHYISTTRREVDGRFCVGIPLKDEPDCLGDSYFVAKRRFFKLEARFQKDPTLKRFYTDFIHEYANLNHLSEFLEPKPPICYYLPHHPVLKEQSESTKLRVVFNASQPTTSGLSVNDLQMVGPNVQDSLFNILLRFRQYQYVLSGDIEKMYRQVLVRESDRNFQFILWRDNEREPLRHLRLNTITYGFASSSFLSTRCIWQIGEECSDPNIRAIIQRDFYCDDILTGADSERELRHIQYSVSNALAKGCFPLRKYRSNLPNLLDSSLTCEESNLLISNATSTLGIGWCPNRDILHFPVKYAPEAIISKRTILSSTFKIFDPLGLLSLCTIRAKILLQTLWTNKLGWDDPVPHSTQAAWRKFSLEISNLASLSVPRLALLKNATHIELHCFCDASQQAYASCIYLQSKDKDGNEHISLLCAKSRVAPIKTCSIPRLELCGALLGAQLSSTVKDALRCDIKRYVYWTDSSVVIGWLRTPNKTKTFVANRVAAICELTDPKAWRHVPTSENPADLATRGVDPIDVSNSKLWWNGPSFLRLPESSWPIMSFSRADLPELKVMPALVMDSLPVVPNFNFQRYSNLATLQRVYTRVLRFLHNCKNPNSKLTGTLEVCELNKALHVLIKLAQNDSFSKEMTTLRFNKTLKVNTHLCSLNPFIDDEGLLRVGGRIKASSYPYEKRHPIVLKASHHLTKLIFQSEHSRLLHAGPQCLLASIRERYWPIGGRRLARDVTRHCFVCRRFKGDTMSNIMGNLPNDRVEPDLPFSTVAIDFAGPFLITDRKGRGCKITKCYLCVFVCFRYKCLHLEVVSELTKDAFILTLNRFISRRGLPKTIYCDNGRNFVAAAKEIGSMLQANRDSICDFSARRGIEFRFSPVYAPHFNGLVEAGVKSAKFHLHRIVGKSHLTFEELTSVFAQIEAILNSRPLCPLSPSPNDFQALTPAHFLIGRTFTTVPTMNYLDSNPQRLHRFQRLEQLRQHFWQRWSSEYVAELQQRTKWRVKCRDLRDNDLVLIKEPNESPLCWRLGRVKRLYLGPDQIPRVADVNTTHGTIRRAINRLVLLPSDDNT